MSEYGSSNGYVDGSEPQFYDIRYQPVEQGRWITWNDETQRNTVCVIGDEFKRILFPGRPVIGSRLLINGVPFQVIGTIKRIGHGNNADKNLRLIMPFSTMATYFPMKGEGNAKAVKYVVYQPITASNTSRPRNLSARLSPETMASIPLLPTLLTIGIPSPAQKWSGRFPTRWMHSWARLAW